MKLFKIYQNIIKKKKIQDNEIFDLVIVYAHDYYFFELQCNMAQ